MPRESVVGARGGACDGGLGGASAATFEVLSAGAVEPGLLPAAEAFRRQTGHEARIRFATAPALRQRVGGGEAVDMVIAPPAVLDDLAKTGRVDGAARVVVGKVGVGVAVRDGAPQPDVRTPEALKRAILGAESVIYNRASTGLYLETLFQRLGIAQEIAARSTRYPDGASVMEHLIKGSGREIGFGAITEIVLFRDKGLKLAGPLPPELQNYTTYAASPGVGLGARRAGEELRPVPRQPGRASDLRGKRHRIVRPAPPVDPSATKPLARLSLAQARRIALAAQGFAEPRPQRPGRRHVGRVLDRLGLVQIDSVNVLARAHYMPLFSRLGPYDRSLLDEAAYHRRRRSLFEYWGHEASLIRLDLHPLLRWRMRRAERGEGTYGSTARFGRERPDFVRAVLAQIEARGPLSARELTEGGTGRGSWWGWSDGKQRARMAVLGRPRDDGGAARLRARLRPARARPPGGDPRRADAG